MIWPAQELTWLNSRYTAGLMLVASLVSCVVGKVCCCKCWELTGVWPVCCGLPGAALNPARVLGECLSGLAVVQHLRSSGCGTGHSRQLQQDFCDDVQPEPARGLPWNAADAATSWFALCFGCPAVALPPSKQCLRGLVVPQPTPGITCCCCTTNPLWTHVNIINIITSS
jgi:hypothetical protein